MSKTVVHKSEFKVNDKINVININTIGIKRILQWFVNKCTASNQRRT